MNIKTSRFLLLLNDGLVIMLLSGCTALVMTSVEEVDADPWDRFEAELESLPPWSRTANSYGRAALAVPMLRTASRLT
jgi:outer membrane biogenesis lipoprotein LolB